MANMYANPAQAQFVNTYVPIPFDALMGLSENAKLERQANEQRLQDIRTKFGSFTSRSQADMARWNQEVTQPLQQVANQIASNPDAVKGEEGRMLLAGVTNNMNYGLLDRLRQNAINLEESYKSYDPRWQDDTLSNITNWDTASKGLYERQNIPFQTIENLGEPYFKNLKPGFVPELSDAARSVYGITQRDLERVSSTAFNSLYADPTFQKHMNRLGISTDTPEGQEAARRIILQSRADKPYISKVEENQSYVESLKHRNRMALESVKQRNRKGLADYENDLALNRVNSNVESFLTSTNQQNAVKRGEKNVETLLRTNNVNTGNSELDSILQSRIDRFNQLAVDSRTRQLTPQETTELNSLRNNYEGVVEAMSTIGEQDSQIKALSKFGYEGAARNSLDPLRQTRDRILQQLIKINSKTNPNQSQENRAKDVSNLNRLNNLFNSQIKTYVDQTAKFSSDRYGTNRKELLDELSGFDNKTTNLEPEMNSYWAKKVGQDYITEKTYKTTTTSSGTSYSVTDTKRKLGIPLTAAGIFNTRDYRPGSGATYINPSENSAAGRFARLLYEDPSYFATGYSGDTAQKYGATVANPFFKSDQGKGKVLNPAQSSNPNDLTFVGKITGALPIAKIESFLNSENISTEGKTNDQIATEMQRILGYKPKLIEANGIPHLVVDGGATLYDDPDTNRTFNFNWSKERLNYTPKKSVTDSRFADSDIDFED